MPDYPADARRPDVRGRGAALQLLLPPVIKLTEATSSASAAWRTSASAARSGRATAWSSSPRRPGSIAARRSSRPRGSSTRRTWSTTAGSSASPSRTPEAETAGDLRRGDRPSRVPDIRQAATPCPQPPCPNHLPWIDVDPDFSTRRGARRPSRGPRSSATTIRSSWRWARARGSSWPTRRRPNPAHNFLGHRDGQEVRPPGRRAGGQDNADQRQGRTRRRPALPRADSSPRRASGRSTSTSPTPGGRPGIRSDGCSPSRWWSTSNAPSKPGATLQVATDVEEYYGVIRGARRRSSPVPGAPASRACVRPSTTTTT